MALIGRRRFLVAGATSGATLLPFMLGYSPTAHGRDYGALIPDPAGILDLPAGFSYTVVQEATGTMSDGFSVPGRPDGMACFALPDGDLALMRNHEVSLLDPFNGPYLIGQAPPQAYDAAGHGGVTRVVVDATTGALISSNLVLAGTARNCAGGLSPWGWLTCEESMDLDHGYVFLTNPAADAVQEPLRIPGYGRFNHEAATVDPATNIAYLTEDRGDSAIYRFVPDDPMCPFVGQLQALRIVGADGDQTTTWMLGQRADYDWVDIDDFDPVGDTVRAEAHGKGAAFFVRGEGIWFHDDAVWFSCTSGGLAGLGQVFRMTLGREGGELELVVSSTADTELDAPDNIAISPWGQLFMCEDGGGTQFVRVLTDQGTIAPFARNAISTSEFAGVCLSPDGTIMFVNIQGNGLTLAVTGPFPPPLPDAYDGSFDPTIFEDACPGAGGESGGSDDDGDETGMEVTSGGDGTTGPAGDEGPGDAGESGGGGGQSSSGGGCSVAGTTGSDVLTAAVVGVAAASVVRDRDTPEDA